MGIPPFPPRNGLEALLSSEPQRVVHPGHDLSLVRPQVEYVQASGTRQHPFKRQGRCQRESRFWALEK